MDYLNMVGPKVDLNMVGPKVDLNSSHRGCNNGGFREDEPFLART